MIHELAVSLMGTKITNIHSLYSASLEGYTEWIGGEYGGEANIYQITLEGRNQSIWLPRLYIYEPNMILIVDRINDFIKSSNEKYIVISSNEINATPLWRKNEIDGLNTLKMVLAIVIFCLYSRFFFDEITKIK